MFSKILDFINDILVYVVQLLPGSPFTAFFELVQKNETVNIMLGYLNFFMPVALMLQILSGWLVCIGLYYIISPLLHWSKAVKS